jgi:hypothetical protein
MHRSPGLSVIPQLLVKIPMIGFRLHQWKGSVHQPRLVTCLDEFAPIGFKLDSEILQFPIFCHRSLELVPTYGIVSAASFLSATRPSKKLGD